MPGHVLPMPGHVAAYLRDAVFGTDARCSSTVKDTSDRIVSGACDNAVRHYRYINRDIHPSKGGIMGRSSRRTSLADRVTPRTKLWLEVNSQYVFGLGISEILKAVQHTGSIKAAAREVGKSYRHVWDKIKQAEQALGVPLVRTQVGGKDARRSELSDLAQDLVRDYDGFRQRLFDLVQVEFSQHLRDTLAKHGQN
jgi:molybdate transport system regulatory protein